MRYSERLLSHAFELVSMIEGGEPRDEIRLHRSVSASYYALFHRINEDAAQLIAPNVPPETLHRIQRWFEHAELKRTCGRFLKETLEQPLLGLIGRSASSNLQFVCRTFIRLQEARNSADYDQGYTVNLDRAQDLFFAAGNAIQAWSGIAASAEANIFVLSLLLWKQWDKERA